MATGIRPQYVEFDSNALTNWSAILQEPDKRGLVGSLIEVALGDYPGDADLLKAQTGGALRKDFGSFEGTSGSTRSRRRGTYHTTPAH